MFTDRKTSYKVPPTTITDKLVSQGARRSKALEEQKRRRAKKVDSFRQLDLFADLNLGPSDDEGEINSRPAQDDPEIAREGLASFVSMLEPSKNTFESMDHLQESQKDGEKKTKAKRKPRGKGKGNKPNKWADKCMYAELLEMTEDDPWSFPRDGTISDGLPNDLESGWVAVAPVPVGKRCLAVTHQSSGLVGISPNTTLRSRVLGKSLIPRFPSSLPPLTILDCILDPNWRDNGILHVLDVLKWKGQDVGDCETPFRFWWRDTRLAELPCSPPPSINVTTFNPAGPIVHSPTIPSFPHSPTTALTEPSHYRFPYPTTFLPIPYYTNTTLPFLSSEIIPLARSTRFISVDIPFPPISGISSTVGAIMEVDNPSAIPIQFPPPKPSTLTSVSAEVIADGLLLYVAQASYEPGTSPLSSWIPIVGYNGDQFCGTVSNVEGPLDQFERLVKRRMERTRNKVDGRHDDVTMDIET